MRNIRLTIAYDGFHYQGWQRLGSGKAGLTIQGKLEAVLSRMTGEEITLVGSGRTDAGVHAFAQVANFHADCALDAEEILAYCHAWLPDDIVVEMAEDVDMRFHARYNPGTKYYRYLIDNGPRHDVFARRMALHVPERLDTAAMRVAAGHMVGAHDFRSFTKLKKSNKTTVRNVTAVRVETAAPFVRLAFEGDGFLQNMVRIMAGTLLEVGLGRLDADRVPAIIAAKVRP
mgnify:CR=1 FL=1